MSKQFLLHDEARAAILRGMNIAADIVGSTLGPAEFWGDFSDFDDGGRQRYAFKIANLRVIPEAHRPEITGRQGFFDVPNEIGLWSL